MGCFIVYDNNLLSNPFFTFLVKLLVDDCHVVHQFCFVAYNSLLEPKLHGFCLTRSLMFNLMLNCCSVGFIFLILVIIYSTYYFYTLSRFLYLHTHLSLSLCICNVMHLLCEIPVV